MEVSWYCWVTVISLVTNFHGCLCWPTLQPPLRPVTSKHELDSDESRKVLGSSVVTSVSVIMDHGNGTKTFISDGMENPELKTNIIGSPGNLLSPDKYEFYTFDETGDLVKRLMTWDEIQGLIAGGEGEGILGEASMPMYYSDTLPDKMGSTHLTANDFQTSDIQGVHKVVESVQNVLKSELAASQNKIPPIAKPPVISNAPNWSLFLPSILDNAEDGSELNNLPGMLVSPSTHFTSITTGMETNNPSSFSVLPSITEIMPADPQNGTEIPTTNAFAEMTTTPFKEYTKKPEKPIRLKTTTAKPSTLAKNTFTPPTKISTRLTTVNNFVSTSTYPSTPFKKYSTTKYGGFVTDDHWFSTSTVPPSTSKKNDYWYTVPSSVPTSTKRNEFWHSTTSTEPTPPKRTEFWYSTTSSEPTSSKRNDFWYSTTSAEQTSSKRNEFWHSTTSAETTSSKKNDNWFSTTSAAPTLPKKTFTSSKYGGYLSNDESSTVPSFTTRKTPLPFNKFGESFATDKYGWPSAGLESTSTSQKPLTTSKYGGYSTNNELFASIASVLNQVTDDVKPTGALASGSSPTIADKSTSTTLQYKISTEANRLSTSNKFQHRTSTEPSIQVTTSKNKLVSATQHYPAELIKSSTSADIFKTASTMQHKFSAEPTRFTVTLSESHQPVSSLFHKFSPDGGKFTEKINVFQHKSSTESYTGSDNRKTVPPFSKFTSSLTSNKYSIPENVKIASSTTQRISTEPTRITSQTAFKITSNSQYITESTSSGDVSSSATRTENSSSSSFNTSETSPIVETPAGFSNYIPLSTSELQLNDTFKSTKTYTSSTTPPMTQTNSIAPPMAHVTLQKQPLTMKPAKPIKHNATKGTTRPSSYTPSVSVIRPQSTTTTFTLTEKPLVHTFTPDSTATEPTSIHPETLVTWISTYPLEEAPSKVALNGVFDSDKLVTEQYVSSHHNRQPITDDFFKNATTTATVKETTHLVTSTDASTTDNRPATLSSLANKLNLTTLPHSSSSISISSYATTSKNNVPTSLSSIFEPSRPFRTSERPFYTIESKTEPINASTHTHHHPTPSHNFVHTVPTEYTEVKVIKTTTTKPVTSPAISSYNYSSSETVMQRVPTINPPSKIHTNGSSSNSSVVGHKSSTKPQYLSTEATKNITQIAVMVNKSNDTSIRTDLQQRNKVTTRPIFETTKPIDCITSSSTSNQISESSPLSATSSHSPSSSSSSPPVSSQKENSPIYYYKLPAITSSPQHELHVYHHKATSTTTTSTTDAVVNAPLPQRKPEIIVDTAVKSSTEKEYQKITIVNHPANDIVQNGISAVTNILLQTEGRVPNKEFVESDASASTAGSAAAASVSTVYFKPSHLTTEHMLRTEQLQSQTRSATANSSSDYSSISTTPVTSSTLENRTSTTSPPHTYSTTTKVLESTSHITVNKAINNTVSTVTTSTTYTTTTSSPTTVEVVSLTDTSNELATTVPTTNIDSDLRHDFVLDDRNITHEEEEDVKNYHLYTYLSANRSGNVIKNSTSTTATPSPSPTAAHTEAPKLKITPSIKPITNEAVRSTLSFNRNITTSTTTSSTTTKTSPSTTTIKPTISTTTTSATPHMNTKGDNAMKADNKTDPLPNGPPPPSSFRSPPSPTPKVPTVTSTTGAGVELHPAPHESMGLEASVAYLGDDVKRFIDFCNELSFKIWTSQTGKSLVTSRSIVLSPFAVLSTLAMIFLGARGSSSGIMNDFLRLDDMVTFNPHQVIQNITDSVVNTRNIGVANAAFVREIFSDKTKGKVLDFYKERLQQYYDTHVEEIPFNIIGDLVRRRTNLLVKRQTQGKMQDYLRGSALVLKPPLAVLTANIFQTDCDIASTDGRDGEMYFVVRPSTRQRRLVPIPAVVYRTGFLAGYEPGLDATAVTLNPESAVSTILVLPGQQGQVAPGDGLARLEQRLLESSYRRGAWSRLLRSLLFRPGLELQIPRFSHKSVLNLTAGLQKMGMADIFAADKADLRGINGLSNELHLSDIVQVNTFSTCGEQTVDARHHIETYPSSPQRVGRHADIFDRTFLDDGVSNYYSSLPLNLRPRQARLPDNPRLRFDRPFLYIVRHNPTGLILYIGRFNPRLLP